jgi:hypothetical protein
MIYDMKPEAILLQWLSLTCNYIRYVNVTKTGEKGNPYKRRLEVISVLHGAAVRALIQPGLPPKIQECQSEPCVFNPSIRGQIEGAVRLCSEIRKTGEIQI